MAKKKATKLQKETLFEERLVPAKPGSNKLFEVSYDTDKPVECLGMKFANDEARRSHFLEKLREKLQDPEFRKIEGFPIGSDEDILALSDPPYYTACPNPFLPEYVETYATPYNPAIDTYHRDPFAFDVSEGKNDPIYNAHVYHTKVPHKAIMRYVLHYTDPNNLILDFFCGTGMTGVASQECSQTANLTYHDILDARTVTPGQRRCILVDLSPIATYISQSYVKHSDLTQFRTQAEVAIKESSEAFGWMYETRHVGWPMLEGKPSTRHNSGASQSKTPGTINFCVWSERFLCSDCSAEFPLANVTDLSEGTTPTSFKCPACGVSTSKRSLSRAIETVYDPFLRRTITRVKRELVLINYTHDGRRYEKHPDSHDAAVLQRIAELPIPSDVPTDELPLGERRLKDAYDNIGITHVHHFYFIRTLHVLSDLATRLNLRAPDHESLLAILFTSQLVNISVMNRFRRVSFPYNPMSGTFYVGSLVSEANPYQAYLNKITKFVKAKVGRAGPSSITSTQSATALKQIPSDTVDYVFVDPPFGRNLHYSELNYIWESWLRVKTNRAPEAVMDRARGRELLEYQNLMRESFREGCRVLKPGRWMTVEFHNSSNAVWNAIQEALLSAGLMVADVRTLDKQSETYKQSQQGLVKADLIISAYKPTKDLEERFLIEAGSEAGAWDFIRNHLAQLPTFVSSGNRAEVLAERQGYLLYDRMIAFHVQRGVAIPLSAPEFFDGLRQRFAEREGMYFLPEQVVAFDKQRALVQEVVQLDLFVIDESSAIQWLKRELAKKPQTYQELTPQFMKEIAGWHKHERMLELADLLKENFVCFDGQGGVPGPIHSYLSTNFHELRGLAKDDAKLISKARNRWYAPDPRNEADLERIRHRTLIREFDEYRQSSGKLKVVRTEALRAGFKECWQKGDYRTIVEMSERVKEEIIQEDSALLMYYDNAAMRKSG